jgi:nucleoid-associated protein YgaU
MKIRAKFQVGISGAGRLHVVQPGENLSSTSTHYYGTRAGWPPICLLNKLPDCNKVYAGQQLIIPNL